MNRCTRSTLRCGRTPWHLGFAALLLGLLPGLAQASVSAAVDRTTVALGEPVLLTLENDSAATLAQPDLAPLAKDFTVLGTSTSHQLSFGTGGRSDLTRWLIQLQPRHAGTLQIPPLAVGSDHTAAIALTVASATAAAPGVPANASAGNSGRKFGSESGRESSSGSPAGAHAFVEIDAPASGHSIYLQQQTPLTVRLYYDDTLRSGELAAPQADNAVIEPLGAEQRSTVMRQGRSYHVVERRYAVSPQKSGDLVIAPVRFEGQAVDADDGSGATAPAGAEDDPFSALLRQTPFANDPFFRDRLRGLQRAAATHSVTAQGRFVDFAVKPRPAAAGSGPWLPAEQVTLHDSWQDAAPQARAGEPLERVITLRAQGLSGVQLPPLSLTDPVGARIYPEVPTTESRSDGLTIEGSSMLKLAYIPDAFATLQVPAVEVPWWNTTTHRAELARIPARSLLVAPGAGAVPSVAMAAVTTQPDVPPAAVNSGATGPSGRAARLADRAQTDRDRWVALAAVGTLALAAGLLFISRRRRAPRQADATARTLPPRRASLHALKRACETQDAPAARRALLALGEIEWPSDPPRGLGVLASRLTAGQDAVRALERGLYGNPQATWSGAALWLQLRHGLPVADAVQAQRDEAELAALYR